MVLQENLQAAVWNCLGAKITRSRNTGVQLNHINISMKGKPFRWMFLCACDCYQLLKRELAGRTWGRDEGSLKTSQRNPLPDKLNGTLHKNSGKGKGLRFVSGLWCCSPSVPLWRDSERRGLLLSGSLLGRCKPRSSPARWATSLEISRRRLFGSLVPIFTKKTKK